MSLLRRVFLTALEAYVRDEIRRALKRSGHTDDQVQRYLEEREAVDPGSEDLGSMPGP